MAVENFYHQELINRMDKLNATLEELVKVIKEFQFREEVNAARTLTYIPHPGDEDEID